MQENQENKKNGPVDYSKFFEHGEEKPKTGEMVSKKKKKSFISIFKDFWIGSDKKTKTEIIVFLIIVFLTIIILISYIVKSNIGFTQNLLYAPPAE